MINQHDVQRKDGMDAHGLVGTEVQEWWKWELFPACQRAADLYFNNSATNGNWTDHDTKMYNQITKMVGWNTREWGMFWMLLGDHDVRHTWFAHVLWRLHGENVDRTTLPKTHRLYIAFNRAVQEAPSAPKVPDCIQQPIELVYSKVKPAVKAMKKAFFESEGRQPTSYELADMSVRASKEKITPELASACFRHAETSIKVFSGRTDQTVKYQRGAKEWEVHCTAGGLVPRIVAA